MAHLFYNLVLLPRIRDDIAEYKKLNLLLYMALKKVILIPLCESGTCTLREAIIIGSILKVLNPCTAFQCCHALTGRDGAQWSQQHLPATLTGQEIRPALPCPGCPGRVLPVLWHQSLLTLAQRYKADLASEQKAALLELLKLQTPPQISAEIRQELQNPESRDLETATMALH
ncbi:hypothetical protein J4Q44_G00083820 [Coregonus suidteri]|uniref:Uncharacterized protein n=1 Tax=Coregonus suidteri TaxID=861788 RepID=A0AAN8N259_9TELE